MKKIIFVALFSLAGFAFSEGRDQMDLVCVSVLEQCLWNEDLKGSSDYDAVGVCIPQYRACQSMFREG